MKGKYFSSVVLACGFVLVLALAGPASAEKGLFLGTGAGVAIPTGWGDEPDAQNGINLEFLHLGYNFDDKWGVSFQLGGAGGIADDLTQPSTIGDLRFDDMVWAQAYITLSGRYTFYQPEKRFVPYLEFGLGSYALSLTGDVYAPAAGIGGDFEGTFDPVVGCRMAVGGHYYFNNFFLAPEMSYHVVSYSDGELEIDFGNAGSIKDDLDGDNEGANMLVLMLKVGYHFKQPASRRHGIAD